MPVTGQSEHTRRGSRAKTELALAEVAIDVEMTRLRASATSGAKCAEAWATLRPGVHETLNFPRRLHVHRLSIVPA